MPVHTDPPMHSCSLSLVLQFLGWSSLLLPAALQQVLKEWQICLHAVGYLCLLKFHVLVLVRSQTNYWWPRRWHPLDCQLQPNVLQRFLHKVLVSSTTRNHVNSIVSFGRLLQLSVVVVFGRLDWTQVSDREVSTTFGAESVSCRTLFSYIRTGEKNMHATKR